MKRQYLFLCVLLCLAACVKPDQLDSSLAENQAYFDVKGLIEKQVELLESQQVSVQKRTSVNGKDELVSPKEVNWKKELSLFADADINKPVLGKAYKTESKTNEATTVLTHTALEEDLRVRHIEVIKDAEGKPLQLKADFQEHNPIYSAEQHLTMKFADEKAISYQLRGFQKMKMQDTLVYHVETEIQWPDSANQ